MVNFFDVESYEKGFGIYNHDQVSNITELLSSKLVLFESAARKKKLDFEYDLQQDLYVKAHPGALDRITNNLVENAIKYAEENGNVQVKLKGDSDYLKFTVKNNGPSIPENLQQKIFEPYFKLSLSGKKTEGMGMGLSIVRKIIDDLKGEIGLYSDDHSGTEVEVKLPLVEKDFMPEENNSEGEFEISRRDGVMEKPSILLVEDNAEMIKYLISKLEPDYNLIIAQNGHHALEKLDHVTHLDLIVSDVMMKDMDGFQFCEMVFAKEPFGHIPFISLTARASTEDKIEG